VVEAAARAGLDLPLEAVHGQFDRAVELDHGEEDMAAVYWAAVRA
jgi:hypothetical protein